MEDRVIMETLLTGAKGECDLLMHGSIESSTPNVRNAFTSTLNDTLGVQNQIFGMMSSKGWYQSQPVETQKINAAKQKFSAT